jgi:hypothetical protein
MGITMKRDPIDVFQLIAMKGKDECWPFIGNAWGGQKRDKRPYFMANGRRTMAYRWVWELVTGDTLTEADMILHSCDNGGWPIGCCNPHHMRKGTHTENTADMTNRQRHGLPGTVVRAIRRLLDQGDKQEDIARLYGLTRETVSAIATQRAYKHLGEDNEADG